MHRLQLVRLSCQKGRHRSSGFTLIELFVVVAILGVASAVTIPAGVQFFSRLKLDAARDEVTRAVRLAQINARRYNENWGVSVVEPPNSPIQIQAMPLDNAGNLDPNRCNRKSCVNEFLEATVELTANSFAANTLVFNERGEVNGILGRFQMGNPNLATPDRCVVISSLLGAVRTVNEGTAPCL